MKVKKKILILGKNPPPYYGVSVWFEQLQSANWPDKYQMLWFDTGIHKEISTIGRVKLISFIKHFILNLKFYSILFREKPDLIVIPISQSKYGIIKDSIYILITVLFSGKVLVMLHGSNLKKYLDNSSKLLRKYFKLLMRQCYGAIVLSDKLKFIFSDYFRSERIFSVPNGLDVKLIGLEPKSSNNIPTICYLGNLYLSKGIEDILKALLILKNEDLNFRTIFIGGWGDKDTKDKCEEIVRANDLNVHFEGVKTGIEKFQLLKNSDLFLFTPNKPEGLPYVILEAMSVGLPIITTNQGGIVDAVIDSENGLIVETSNSYSISKAIHKLLKDRDLMISMGQNSKRIYKDKFTAKHMVDNFVSSFESVLY